MAASFNPALLQSVSSAIATEAEALGVSHLFAPVLDLSRELRWGRVEENFGEDPFLFVHGPYPGGETQGSPTLAARAKWGRRSWQGCKTGAGAMRPTLRPRAWLPRANTLQRLARLRVACASLCCDPLFAHTVPHGCADANRCTRALEILHRCPAASASCGARF